MSSKKQTAPQLQTHYFHTGFLMRILHRKLLVAAPYADIIADPFSFGDLPEIMPIPILFSDIPDVQFRKPKDIISIELLGGTKS
jgi:hypothetical protein